MQAKKTVLLAVVSMSVFGCASKKPLDNYVERQTTKVQSQTSYNQAEVDFWAATYEPTLEDLENLRASWMAYSQSFPESKEFEKVETEVRRTSQRVVLVSLFMSAYERADLKDKALGWSVSPRPSNITELSEKDVVLRTLMPVKNDWARYFLLQYDANTWESASELVVSNRRSRLVFKRLSGVQQYTP